MMQGLRLMAKKGRLECLLALELRVMKWRWMWCVLRQIIKYKKEGRASIMIIMGLSLCLFGQSILLLSYCIFKRQMQGKLVNAFMNEKAGMSEVDKKNIAETIERLTAGTPKSIHEKEMQEKRGLQIAEMLRKCLAFTPQQREQMRKQWWKDINEMKKNRPLDRYWAHFDFDMFYIACQLLQRPELKDKPCAVGGKNSVLSTANYEARKYGLRAAMPTFIALELCPQVVLFQPNFAKYKHFSNIFREILQTYDPELESHGLDEAYIDMTPHLQGKSTQEIEEIIASIRQCIFQRTGLTVSCGVGANKMLAKIASEQRKPNNQFVLENDPRKIEEFVQEKKLRKIPGIGPVNEYYLKGLGIETGKDILQNLDVLTICFSKLSTEFFVSAALGCGSIQHEFKERKSVGKSETFKTTEDLPFLEERLKSLCQEVSVELQQLGFMSINVVMSYQTNNFEKRDKTFNLLKYTDKSEDLHQPLTIFLKSIKSKLRLLGVKCTSLIKSEDYRKQQIMSFLNNPKKLKQAMNQQKNSVDHIKSLMRSDIIEKGKYLCPICNEYIDCKGNLSIFNKHVDKCLNPSTTNTNTNTNSSSVKEAGKQRMKNASMEKTAPKGKAKSEKGGLLTFLQKK